MQSFSPSDSMERRDNPGGSESTARHVTSSNGIRRTFADDSWVEVSSRPSSSSLSSANEEIITTGLRVRQDSAATRRRRRHSRQADQPSDTYDPNEQESEQEDDSDQVMETFTDEVPSAKRQQQPASAHSSVGAFASAENSSEDSDENATAVGVASPNDPFVPRPNTFSLPPRPQEQHASHPGYAPPTRPYRATQRHSYPSQPQQHSPFSAISPSHHVDHDAALRASLSTLLSYANAARSLPKTERSANGASQNRPAGGNRIDVTTLGLVPESVALGEAAPTESRNNADITTEKKVKRKSDHRESRSSSKDRDRSRSKKQARRNAITAVSNNMETVSPTLLTWVVGAGMIVLVSAISFSAGYVVGKEAGAGFTEGFMPGSNGEHASDGVSSLTSGLSGNVAGTGGSMRRNLASKGGAIGLGMGWGGNAVGAGAGA